MAGFTTKLTATLRLLVDARIWLLSFLNVAFGFSAAFMNGYFNSQILAVSFGSKYVGNPLSAH